MQSVQRVHGLLQAMLRSVARQQDPNYCAVVVTNACSNRPPDLSGVSHVEVDFPAPCPKGTVRIDYRLRMLDKGAKLVIGALQARAMGATHVMFFDYDDVAHHQLS